MGEGRIRADGEPAEVVTGDRVAEVYGAKVLVDEGPSGRPRVTPLSEAAITRMRGGAS
jgi:ABC-type hemin transport system ATPase subunit